MQMPSTVFDMLCNQTHQGPRNKNESSICFHSSTQIMLPVRRRRRGTKQIDKLDDTDDNFETITTLQRLHAPVSTSKEFSVGVLELIAKLQVALEPMRTKNEFFTTKQSQGEAGIIFTIDFNTKDGFYQIEVNDSEHVFEYRYDVCFC